MTRIMHPKDDSIQKTLGPKAGNLVLTLYERKHPIFQIAEAHEILGGDLKTVRQLVFDMVKRGLATRLKGGLFRLIPFELGFERDYLGNPYVVARELFRARRKKVSNENEPYYLSHGSAFDLHQMLTQPQFVVYVTTPKLIRPRTVLGTEFRFVRCKPSDLFGITELWAEKSEKVRVSDLERTILDGLKQPTYCGGFTEVAKGFWIKRHAIDPKKIVNYALQLNIGAVNRRLGFLMELYEVSAPLEIEQLKSSLTATYSLLDPDLEAKGKFLARWRLRLNVEEDELKNIVRA